MALTAVPRIYQFIEGLGYERSAIREDYEVWLGPQRVMTVDAAVFSQPNVGDFTTSAMVCKVDSGSASDRESALLAADALAAPAVLMVSGDSVQIFPTVRRDTATPWRRIEFDDFEAVERLRPVLGPQALLAAKHGAARQLMLFPFDASILARRRLLATDSLSGRVTAVFADVLDRLGPTNRRNSRDAARIVVNALALAVLVDKGVIDDQVPLDVAMQRFPRHFSSLAEMPASRSGIIDAALTELRLGIDYSAIDPSVLSEVYQRSLSDEDVSKSLGIVYTPPELARALVATLPFEVIAPAERRVFDPTCGSGTLLLVAHDRLATLQPLSTDPGRLHADLLERLIGWDTDEFAIEIAKLCLLLHTLPLGNGWHIDNHDALNENGASVRPTVIVMNPPWAYKTQAQAADAYLRRAIRWLPPGGLIGAILPGTTFTHRPRAVRRELDELCDVFEVWQLPERSFTTTKAAPSVAFARKRKAGDSAHRPMTVKRVMPRENHDVEIQALSAFYRTLAPDVTTYEPGPQISGAVNSLLRTSGCDLIPLSKLADVVNGPQRNYRDLRQLPSGEENCYYFSKNEIIEPFRTIAGGEGRPSRYPEDFRRGRSINWLLGGRKIAVRAYSNPTNQSRRLIAASAAPDVVIGNSSLLVAVKDKRHFAPILAYLNSELASALIDERSPGINVTIPTLRSLSVPASLLSDKELAALSDRLIRGRGPSSRTDLRHLDDLVLAAVGRQPLIDRLLSIRFGRDTTRRPIGGALPDAPSTVLLWRAGATIAASSGDLRLALPGVSDDDYAAVRAGSVVEPSSFLGYLARGDRCFEFAADAGDPSSARFRFQSVEWQEELEEPSTPPDGGAGN